MTETGPTAAVPDHASGLWPAVHTERAALADDLANLIDEQWATRSLCTEFTVREVLAHLTAGASMTFPRWMAGVIRCRFDFDKQVAMRLAEYLGDSPADTLTWFRRSVTNTSTPLGWRGSPARDRPAAAGRGWAHVGSPSTTVRRSSCSRLTRPVRRACSRSGAG